MKKNGYTVVELLVLIGIIALSAVLILPKLSLAFQDKREDTYETDLRMYLKDAEIYGETKKEEIKNQGENIKWLKINVFHVFYKTNSWQKCFYFFFCKTYIFSQGARINH